MRGQQPRHLRRSLRAGRWVRRPKHFRHPAGARHGPAKALPGAAWTAPTPTPLDIVLAQQVGRVLVVSAGGSSLKRILAGAPRRVAPSPADAPCASKSWTPAPFTTAEGTGMPGGQAPQQAP